MNSEGESNLPIVAASETISASEILPPVKTDESTTYKAGSTLPVKFQLMDEVGNYLSGATAEIYVEDANGVSTSSAVKRICSAMILLQINIFSTSVQSQCLQGYII